MKHPRIFYSKGSKYSVMKNKSEWRGLFLLLALIRQLEFMGIQLLFIYKLRNARNDVEAFTFLTFQRPRLKPKPISRFMPNLKAEGKL